MPDVLKLNDRGNRVLTLTRLLVDRGYLRKPKAVFDKTVQRAVNDFQARHVDELGRPLVADGVVGPLTWWALRNPDNRDVPVPTPQDSPVGPGGSSAGRAALKVALGEMRAGACELASNNSGRWVEKYLNGITPAPANWCAGFVSWCYSQIPGGIPFQYSLGARDIRMQFQRKGWAFDATERKPEPGAIIVWWRDRPDGWQGHIGLVHHCSDGIVHTIEGNKGGFPAPVRLFDYVQSRIDRLLGFGRVP
jgi:hypothetical protein